MKLKILFLAFILFAIPQVSLGAIVQNFATPDGNNDITLHGGTDENCDYDYNFHFEKHNAKYPLINYVSGGSGSTVLILTEDNFKTYDDDYYIEFIMSCQSVEMGDTFIITGTSSEDNLSVDWHSYSIGSDDYFEGDINFLSPSVDSPVVLPNMSLSVDYWNYGASVAPYETFDFNIYSVNSSLSLYSESVDISTDNVQELKNYSDTVTLPIVLAPGFYMITGELSNDIITSPLGVSYFQIVLTLDPPDLPTFVCDSFPDTWTGNLFNYICGWIVPGEGVIEDNISTTTSNLKNAVPFVSQIHSLFMSSGLISVADSSTAPVLADSGEWNGAKINFSSGFSILEPVISTVKSFISIGIYLILLLFLYRKTPLLFKSK